MTGFHRHKIRSFIEQNFFFCDGVADLPDDASLLESGIIDSTGILEVIAFLETEFGMTIADEEIVPENLDSISAIAAFIQAKTAKELSA